MSAMERNEAVKGVSEYGKGERVVVFNGVVRGSVIEKLAFE